MNLKQKKVQKIIVFTGEASKKFSEKWMNEKAHEIDDLVYNIVTNFRTLLETFNELVDKLENEK